LLETPFVLRAQADHEDLLRAITRREAVRAENLMREHAYRSRENKRVLLESLRGALPAQPGLSDVSA
jgi:GntR family transcriptional regulator of vanillate catabolism